MNDDDDAGWEFETVKGDDVPCTLNQIQSEEEKSAQLTQLTVRPRQSSVLPSSLRLLFNGDHATFGSSSATISASAGRAREEPVEPGSEIDHSYDPGFSDPILSGLQDGSYPFPDLADAEIHTTKYGESHFRERQSTAQEMSPNHIPQNLPSHSAFAEPRERPNSDLYSMNDPPREVLDSASLSSEFLVRSPKTLNTTPATSRLVAVIPSGKGIIPQPLSNGQPDPQINNFGTPGLKDVIKVVFSRGTVQLLMSCLGAFLNIATANWTTRSVTSFPFNLYHAFASPGQQSWFLRCSAPPSQESF